MIYKYKAISLTGVPVDGVVEADDEYEAVEKIRESCSVVTKLSPVWKISGILSMEIGPKQMDARQMSLLCSQLGAILDSGVPLVKAVELIAGQIEDKKLAKILRETGKRVASGRSLSDSFYETDQDAFGPIFLETVAAGERSGTLEKSFENLASYYERQYKMKQKVAAAMTYPCFVVMVAVAVVAVVMLKVIPTMAGVLMELGGELPLPTRILMGISGFFQNHFLKGVVLFMILMILAMIFSKKEQGRLFFHRWKLRIPFAGKIQMLTASGHFAHTMAAMLSSGLSLPQALDATARSTDNYVLAKSLDEISRKIEEGWMLGDCMKEAGCYPEVLTEVCAMGEETGELEKMLSAVGEYFDNQTEYAAQAAIARLEPTLLILLAIFTGFIVISIYLPLFHMYDLM